MRRLGGGVRLGVDRPHRQAAKAQAAQQGPHRALRQLHLEALLDHARQIGPCASAPPHARPGLAPGRPTRPPAPAARRSNAAASPGGAGPSALQGLPHCSGAPSPSASDGPSPHVLAASVRERPSSTSAKASIRRAAGPSLLKPASRRSPAASNSPRVIETATIPDLPRIRGRESRLTLQLRSRLKMGQSCGSLVSSSPMGPGKDVSGPDLSLGEADGDSTDFLNRPAD